MTMNRRLYRGFTASVLYLIFLNAAASGKLPTDAPVPGGIALVRIPLSISSEQRPRARFQGKRVMVLAANDQRNPSWVAAIGIPLKTAPGQHSLAVSFTAQAKQEIKFQVSEHRYREQHITLSNQRQVNPNKLDLKRIGREKKEMTRAFGNWDDSKPVTTQLRWPLTGEISSPFGLQRFYNGEPRNPHSGLDIAAPQGTPVRAPAKAHVVASGDYFFNGLTVMLDHGHGLITLYCHLSQIDVAPGSEVAAGQIIGQVGKTGRATGPHLHWSVSLNDARINPYLLMPPQPDSTRPPEETTSQTSEIPRPYKQES